MTINYRFYDRLTKYGEQDPNKRIGFEILDDEKSVIEILMNTKTLNDLHKGIGEVLDNDKQKE